MAERVQLFEISVPAGQTIAVPQNTALAMDDGVTRRIEIIVPPGPSGLVGIRILHSGTIVIPYSGNTWLVTDDEKVGWDFDGLPTNSKWTVRMYNLDIYAHTIYFRWLLDEIPSAPAAPLVPIAIE